MKVEFKDVKAVFDTLPISYYLGKGINTMLDEKGSESYYNPKNEEIHISFPMVKDTLAPFEEKDLIETAIRCVLYHEISHVILTPRNLYDLAWNASSYVFSERKPMGLTSTVFNIFEDERIESILRGYYMGVNFKWFVKAMNHWNKDEFEKEDTKDPTNLFYAIVRFDYDKYPELLEIKNQIIAFYPDIIGNEKLHDFSLAVWNLYKKICELCKKSELPEPPKPPKKEDVPPEDGPDKRKGEEGKPDGEKPEKGDPGKPEIGETGEPGEEEKTFSADAIKKIIDKALKKTVLRFENAQIKSKLADMIHNAIEKRGRMEGSSTGYTGRFNRRALSKDLSKVSKTYEWFLHTDSKGSNKRFSKIKLNMFVDVSGSFSGSQDKINQIINALISLEKKLPLFTFDVIKMGDTNRIADRKDRYVTCNEGNYLKNEIIDMYKQVQASDANNYNIVVFDGDAQSFDCWSDEQREEGRKENLKAFTAWNHPNCAVISSRYNRTYFENANVTQCRFIYTSAYASELENNVYKVLGMLLK